MSSIVSRKQVSKSNLKEKKMENRGKMKYRTCFSSVSFHGYKLDLLKSGVQKYLRRREYEKMVWCALEIWRFEEQASSELEKKMCKGIISNLLNRIIVMMDEEMIFNECTRYIVLRKLIEKFESDRKNGKLLVKMCYLLANSKMIRRNSDIRGFWNYRFKNEIVEEKEDEFYFEMFKKCFEEKDSKLYYWMFKIFDGKKKGEKVRFRRKENIYMIWEYLFSRKKIKENSILKKCLEYRLTEFYKINRKERFIFLTASIDIALYANPQVENVKKLKEIVDFTKNLNIDFAEFLKKRDVYMQIDDYAIDMHTSMGRKMGKTKRDFILAGGVVVNEDKEFLEKEWRKCYNDYSLNCGHGLVSKKKKEKAAKLKKDEQEVAKALINLNPVNAEENVEKKEEVNMTRAQIRSEKYKRIKKMRGKPNFDDLEKDLEFVDSKTIDVNKIKLCSDTTCGNKVMCFEYEGKIWKESRESMNYNRDYCVVDECKEAFGLRKIGMKRVLANFRIEKSDRTKKSWKDNWKMVSWGPTVGDNKDTKNKVVYCVMNKITNCMWKVPMEFGVIKHSIVYGAEKGENIGRNRELFKEFVKIGVFRGIFRCSDFNCRNVLVGLEPDPLAKQYLVSIDEGDIGKRLDILGGKEKWLVEALNKDKSIIKEIIDEVLGKNETLIWKTMKKYCFSDDLCYEVKDNMRKLIYDLQQEGVIVEFD